MASKKRPEKRARVEVTDVGLRHGVMKRGDKYTVEMRLPQHVAQGMKLHLGTYKNREDAHIARDCGAHLRISTGREEPATAGGYRNPDVHKSIYEFEESREVFERLEGWKARCEQFKRLLDERGTGGMLPEEFNKAAREDIRAAIRLLRSGPLNHLPTAEGQIDGELQSSPPPSRSEVSPTPGCEVEAAKRSGTMNFTFGEPLELTYAVNGSLVAKTLKVPLAAEQISKIVEAGFDKINNDLIDKVLEEAEQCPIPPLEIPRLEY